MVLLCSTVGRGSLFFHPPGRCTISQEIKMKDSDTGLNMLKNNPKLYLQYIRSIETYLKYKIFLIDIESGI